MSKTLIIICTLLAINIIAFALYAIDKRKAIKGKWRISEKVLLLWSLFGPWGGYAGMKVMHHKTNHKKFTILVPLFMVIHILLVIWLVYSNIS